MKYRILAVVVIFIALFGITVNAAGFEYTLTPDKNFTSAQYGDDLSEISKKLNMTTSELNSYFSQNGLIYLAVSDDNKTQIKLSAFTDNFSSAAGDISNLNDQALAEFVSAVCDDGEYEDNIVLNNGRKFVCVKNTLKDSGGIYTVTQYITICDSKTFYFAGYNEGEETSNEILAAFKSFNLNDSTNTTQNTIDKQAKLDKYYLLINCGVVIFALVAIVSIIGIIHTNIITRKERIKNED